MAAEPTRIKSRTKADDVRKAAGFSWPGWRMFLSLTHVQATQLVSQDASTLGWPSVNYSQRLQLLQSINQQLQQQGLPAVDEETYHWRMSQAIPPVSRQSKNVPHEVETSELAEAERDDPPSQACTTSGTTQTTFGETTLPPLRERPEIARYLGPSGANSRGD